MASIFLTAIFWGMQVLAAACIVALGLCAVLFAVGEQAGEEDSVRNLLLATKASTSQLAAIKKKVQLMSPKQQMLYDSGMEDEAHKAMHIAYQTFMKAKDEGVLTEYDDLNATITEEQDALVDYADEMAVSFSGCLLAPSRRINVDNAMGGRLLILFYSPVSSTHFTPLPAQDTFPNTHCASPLDALQGRAYSIAYSRLFLS